MTCAYEPMTAENRQPSRTSHPVRHFTGQRSIGVIDHGSSAIGA
jgi:hypothetical protein